MKAERAQQLDSTAHLEQYRLRLYVAGNNRQSMHAITNIKNICEQYLKDCYELEVIDLYLQPDRAKKDQIIAIPTLVKELPLPLCRIIGDLADIEKVCESLDIRYRANQPAAAQPVRGR